MAINDIDHVFHVIYEKFAENQKDKKYEERVYIDEDEFIHDLKEFVKKSEVEDKGLLISEIYRSISEDVLEISSDGKITVSPKVLRTVEKKIIDRKNQEELLNNKKNEQTSVNEKDNLNIPKMTSEEFKKLSFDQKVEIVSKTMEKFAKKFGVEFDEEDVESIVELGEMDLNEILSNDPEVRRNQVLEMFNGDTDIEDSIFMELGYTLYDTRKSLLENSPCSKLFVIDGKFDVNLFNYVMDALAENNTRSIEDTYLDACKICGYEEGKAKSILETSASKGVEEGILQYHMSILVDSQSQIKKLKDFVELYKNKSSEEREQIDKDLYQMIEINRNAKMVSERENVSREEIENVAVQLNEKRKSFKTRNMEQAIENRKKVQKVNEIVISGKKEAEITENLNTAQQQRLKRLEEIKNGTRKKRVIKNNSVRTIDGLLISGDKKTIKLTGKIEKGSNVKVEKDISQDEPVLIRNEAEEENALEDAFDMEITDFEVDSFSAMFEDIQLEPMEEPVVEDEAVDLEPSSAPEVIAENNSAIHAETIDVEEPEEKVVQQVEEQAVEENVRNDIESNLPKELTWVDRAKQGLFKVGKTISNVIKAVTDKDSSKGLFERIADAINSDNNSTSDSSSSSGTSSSAGPSVDEKPIQAPVDYLNTQFKVDVKLAAETAKAASEKQAQRRDASSELTQDEEQL